MFDNFFALYEGSLSSHILFTTLHPGSKTTKFNTVVLTLIVKTVLDVNMTHVHIYKPNDVLEADHLIIGSQGLSSSLLSQ